MNFLKTSNLSAAVFFMAITLTHLTAIADGGEVKQDWHADYIDDGVRVIVYEALPAVSIKDGSSLEYSYKYYPGKDQSPTMEARAFDDVVAEAYRGIGFEVNRSTLFSGGTEINQFLAFPLGSLSDLTMVNKSFGRANFIDTLRTIAANTVGVVGGVFVGGAVGGTGGAVHAAVGSLGRDSVGSFNMKTIKTAVFEGYENIPAANGENVAIYGVSTQGGRNSGKVIFITDKNYVDEAVVVRGIIKAQNITN